MNINLHFLIISRHSAYLSRCSLLFFPCPPPPLFFQCVLMGVPLCENFYCRRQTMGYEVTLAQFYCFFFTFATFDNCNMILSQNNSFEVCVLTHIKYGTPLHSHFSCLRRLKASPISSVTIVTKL